MTPPARLKRRCARRDRMCSPSRHGWQIGEEGATRPPEWNEKKKEPKVGSAFLGSGRGRRDNDVMKED